MVFPPQAQPPPQSQLQSRQPWQAWSGVAGCSPLPVGKLPRSNGNVDAAAAAGPATRGLPSADVGGAKVGAAAAAAFTLAAVGDSMERASADDMTLRGVVGKVMYTLAVPLASPTAPTVAANHGSRRLPQQRP